MASSGSVQLLPPAEEVETGPYRLRTLQAPVLRGWALGAFVAAFESWLGGLAYPLLARQSGVSQVLLGLRLPEQPLFMPDVSPVNHQPEDHVAQLDMSTAAPTANGATTTATDEAAWALRTVGRALGAGQLPHQRQLDAVGGAAGPLAPSSFTGGATVVDYARAYRLGAATPTEVAERIIAFVQAGAQRKPPIGWFVGWQPELVRKQAEESTRRLRSGTARSILEGVPYAIKDVADALPYSTAAGTTFIAASRPVTADAPYVAALRAMGAVLLGKTSLHEIGLGITGLNPLSGTALNPLSLEHYTGGSSSGTAAVLAAGLCPVAIGSDGGGSIRIPASFCGLAGLKPSAGRVGGRGVVEVDCTVATMGPLAGCVQDLALLYAVMGHFGPQLEPPYEQPPLALPSPWPQAGGGGPLRGLRIGVYDEWFNDAAPAVVAACRAALAAAEAAGASVEAVVVPELEELRVAHTVTIVSEMLHNFRERYESPRLRAAFNSDVRLALANARFWTPADYLQAQRIRARANIHFRRVLGKVHVLATPTTPEPAPRIHPAALTGGESNLQQVSRVMRFVVAANMLGLPALSLPVGWVPEGEGGGAPAASHQPAAATPPPPAGGDAKAAAAGTAAAAAAAAPPADGRLLLPAGLQLIGRPLQEATLLRVGAVLEAALAKGAAATGGGGPKRAHLNPLTGERRGL